MVACPRTISLNAAAGRLQPSASHQARETAVRAGEVDALAEAAAKATGPAAVKEAAPKKAGVKDPGKAAKKTTAKEKKRAVVTAATQPAAAEGVSE